MRAAYKWLLKWTRTLHIYLSMFALLALFFFAATGFMLNHLAWFGAEPRSVPTAKGELPRELLPDQLFERGGDELSDEELQLVKLRLVLPIVERLRADHGSFGLYDSFDTDDDKLRLVFRSPGRTVDVTVERETGRVEATTESTGLAGRLTDLHKNKNAGGPWGFVVDGVSVLLLFISLTGLLLWVSLKKRLAVGIVSLFAGCAALLVVYYLYVP
jgi:hypothetical protein